MSRRRVAKKPFVEEEEDEEPRVHSDLLPPPRKKRGRPSKNALEPVAQEKPAKRQRVTRGTAGATRDLSSLSIEEVIQRSNAALNKAFKRPAMRTRSAPRPAPDAEDDDDDEQEEDDDEEDEIDARGRTLDKIQVAGDENDAEDDEADNDEEEFDDFSSNMVMRQLVEEFRPTPSPIARRKTQDKGNNTAPVASGSRSRTHQDVPRRSAGPTIATRQRADNADFDMFVSSDDEDEKEDNVSEQPQDTVALDIIPLRKMSTLMCHPAWTGDPRWEQALYGNPEDGPNSGLIRQLQKRLKKLADFLRASPRPRDLKRYDFSDQKHYLEENGPKLGRMYERVKDCVDAVCKERLGPIDTRQHDGNSEDLRQEMTELLLQDIVPLLIYVLTTACTLGGHTTDANHFLMPKPSSPGLFTDDSLAIVTQITEWLLRIQKVLLAELHRVEAAKAQSLDSDDIEEEEGFVIKTKRFALEPWSKQFRRHLLAARAELDERNAEPIRLRAAAQRDAEIRAKREADEDRQVQDVIAQRRMVAQSSQALRTMVDPLREKYQRLMGGAYSINGTAPPARPMVQPTPVPTPRVVSNQQQERYKQIMGSSYNVNGHARPSSTNWPPQRGAQRPAQPPPVRSPSPRPVFKRYHVSPDPEGEREEIEDEEEEDEGQGEWTPAEDDFMLEELRKGPARDLELVARRLGRPMEDVMIHAAEVRKAFREDCREKHNRIPEWAQEPKRSSTGVQV